MDRQLWYRLELQGETLIRCRLLTDGERGPEEDSGQTEWILPQGPDGLQIPEGVKRIQDGAFSGCPGLEKVRLPRSLESLGSQVFLGTDLPLLEISAPLRSVERDAFQGVVEIAVEGNWFLEFPEAFSASSDALVLRAPDVPLEDLPPELQSAGARGFARMVQDGYPFSEERREENRRFLRKNRSKYLLDPILRPFLWDEGMFFWDGMKMTQIMVPDGTEKQRITQVLLAAFFYPGVSLEELEAAVRAWEQDSSGRYVLVIRDGVLLHALPYLPGLSGPVDGMPQGPADLVIPDGIEAIGLGAFCRCGRIRSIRLPAGLKAIREWAFAGCGLRELRIPAGVREIRRMAFSSCRNLRSVTMEPGLQQVDGTVFQGCNALEEASLAEHMERFLPRLWLCPNLRVLRVPGLGVTQVIQVAPSLLQMAARGFALSYQQGDPWPQDLRDGWFCWLRENVELLWNGPEVWPLLLKERMLSLEVARKMLLRATEEKTPDRAAALLEYLHINFPEEELRTDLYLGPD